MDSNPKKDPSSENKRPHDQLVNLKLVYELRSGMGEFMTITHNYSFSFKMKVSKLMSIQKIPRKGNKNDHQVNWNFEPMRDVEEVMSILLTHTYLVSKVAQKKGLSKISHKRNSKFIK